MNGQIYKPVKRKTRRKANLGECRHCDYQPVAKSARFCPHCGGTYPNFESYAASTNVCLALCAILLWIAIIIVGIAA